MIVIVVRGTVLKKQDLMILVLPAEDLDLAIRVGLTMAIVGVKMNRCYRLNTTTSCRKEIRVLFSLSLLFFLFGGCASVVSDPMTVSPHSNHNYSIFYKTDIVEILNKWCQIDDKFRFEIRRSSDRRKLFVFGEFNDSKTVFVIEKDRSPRKLVSPGDISFVNDNEQFVAWTNNYLTEGVNFINGDHLHLAKYGVFGVAPDGKYFFSETTPGIIDISMISFPHNLLLFSVDFRINNIYHKEGKIYLFDYDQNSYKKLGYQNKIICKIYKQVEGNFIELETIDILRPGKRSSPFFVVDFNIDSEQVIVEDTHDMPFSYLNSWYIFDFQTRKMLKIGKAEGNIMFLENNLLSSNKN
jgi:hypothetical protein